MKISNEIICRVEDKVIETYLAAQGLFGRLFELPSIAWDLRGVCAGRAHARKNLIRFNPILLCENVEEFLRQTVPHEVAHLVNRELHGWFVRPHGPEWKSIMRAFGLQPLRCHNYGVENARVFRQHRHAYQCECQQHSISQATHNRIRRGFRYSCRCCGAVIRIVPPVSITSSGTSIVVNAPER